MRAGEVLETVPGRDHQPAQRRGQGEPVLPARLQSRSRHRLRDERRRRAGEHADARARARLFGLEFPDPRARSSGVQFNKGPYSAEEGDFSTAGASHIRYANALDTPIARLSVGGDGWGRALAAASPQRRRRRTCSPRSRSATTTVRGSAPTTTRKVNGVLRYSRGDTRNGVRADRRWAIAATGIRPIRFPCAPIERRHARPRSARLDDIARRQHRPLQPLGRLAAHAQQRRDARHRVRHAATASTCSRTSPTSSTIPSTAISSSRPIAATSFGGRVTHRIGGRDRGSSVGIPVRRCSCGSDNIGTIGLYHTRRSRARARRPREDAVSRRRPAYSRSTSLQWTPWLRTHARPARRSVITSTSPPAIRSTPGSEADAICQPERRRSSSARGHRPSST